MKYSRPIITATVCGLAGLMFTLAAVSVRGGELRPERTSDLTQIAREREQDNKQLSAQLAELREEVDALTAQSGQKSSTDDLRAVEMVAGQTALHGPAVKVTLTDAPLEVKPDNVDPDMLVVHQQDIQVVVNALWRAGAEAMTLQGERVITTTAIKCVGNTVVLHGTPYAPPYEIVAIGNQDALERGLEADEGTQIYRQYAQAYQLGYSQQRISDYVAPAFGDHAQN